MTTQYERDLRSARKEWKRTKDSSAKWSHGSRHLAGVREDFLGRVPANVPEHQLAKFRPGKKPSEDTHHPQKPHHNLVKPRAAQHDVLGSRRRAKLFALGEARDAPTSYLLDSPPLASPSLSASLAAAAAVADPFLYSFDRTDSPQRSLTLEVFVKTSATGKGKGDQTEKLVEREYEVLDGNGEAVRGRRVRAVLRRGGTAASEGSGGGKEAEEGEEDEGFELV